MKAKNILTVALIGVASLLNTSCSTTVSSRRTTSAGTSRSLPPGQAKKINGSKSARAYAPGHNKS